MTTKTFSHSVSIPPLTDVEQFMGAYGSLFTQLNIAHSMPFPPATGFTHPDEETNKTMTMEFFEAMRQLKDSVAMYGSISLNNAIVGSSMVTFIFQYKE
jgi:hypothetical protein